MARTVNSAGVSFRAFFGRMGMALVLCVVLIGAGVFAVNGYINQQIDKIPRDRAHHREHHHQRNELPHHRVRLA